MAEPKFDSFRLELMQNVLPVGLAILERAREGGISKVFAKSNSDNDLFDELRCEGEASAKVVRERLDKVSPGLGNPVVSVDVEVDDQPYIEKADQEALIKLLERLKTRLDLLDSYLLDPHAEEKASSQD